MGRIDKSVFLSYRRTSVAWALAIYQNLTHHGFDVFIDYEGIASGDFEQVILENIEGRSHFLVLLTPSALERINQPDDWLRREIESALAARRNIVPIMLEGFDFATASVAERLVGSLEPLKRYQALPLVASYFDAAMTRLRERHLNVALDAIRHPPSAYAAQAAKRQQNAAGSANPVEYTELTAEQWFERGYEATDPADEIRCFTEVIRLKPDHALAYYNRALARASAADFGGAIADYTEAIRLKSDSAEFYFNRAFSRTEVGDTDGALADYGHAIRLDPRDSDAFCNRGQLWRDLGKLDNAVADLDQAIKLNPLDYDSFMSRGLAHYEQGRFDLALLDYTEAIRLGPDLPDAYYNRALAREQLDHADAAISDYQRYLDLGGGVAGGDQADVEEAISLLKRQ